MPADPFLAIGMVSAPQNFERRRSVRRDMLDLPSIRDGVLVTLFTGDERVVNVGPSHRVKNFPFHNNTDQHIYIRKNQEIGTFTSLKDEKYLSL